MGKHKKKKAPSDNTIALNRKAHHDYFIEQKFECGIALEGWEVKSLREGRVQLKESYVVMKHGEAWLFGAHISALATASTHKVADPVRTRKLLLHRKELSMLIGAIDRKGYTIVPLKLYWKRNHVKCEIALAKGKKLYDKRDTQKDKDWARDQQRIMKSNILNK